MSWKIKEFLVGETIKLSVITSYSCWRVWADELKNAAFYLLHICLSIYETGFNVKAIV